MNDNDKHQKFRKLAPKRVDSMIKKNRLLCNLFNSNYFSTESEKEQILAVADKENEILHKAVESGKETSTGFQFED